MCDPEVTMRPEILVSATIAPCNGTLPVPGSGQTIGAAGQEALEHARSGTVLTWRNPDDGASGSFVPQPASRAPDGRICREFGQTATIGGQLQQIRGTACRQPDGWWQLRHAAVDHPAATARVMRAPAPVTIHMPPAVVYDIHPVYPHARLHHGPSLHVAIGAHRHRHRHFHRHR
jgi:hypothetical protein